MASREAVAEKLEHHFEPIEAMEDDPRIPQAVFVRKSELNEAETAAIGLPLYIGAVGSAVAVVASGGAVALAIAAATAGDLVGGGIGGIVAKAIGDHHAQTIESNIKSGGILLWARVNNQEHEREAIEVLTRCGGRDVHAHTIERTWGVDDIPLHDWQPDPFLR